MAKDEEIMKDMDEAAKQARIELENSIGIWTATELANWWSKWFLKAGHKRLGRMLISVSKDRDLKI
jgi:hypothetical protein